MRDMFSNRPGDPRRHLGSQVGVRVTMELIRTRAEMIERRRRKGRRDGEAGEGIPADPRRPNTLSGGAAAALEFD